MSVGFNRTSTVNAHLRDVEQPRPDSIVRVGGVRGTVYQRFVSDGLWHGTNGAARDWADLVTKPLHVEVMYSAPERMEVGSIYIDAATGNVFVVKEDGSQQCVLSSKPGVSLEVSWNMAFKVFSPADGMISW